jgi:hypothetical protein
MIPRWETQMHASRFVTPATAAHAYPSLRLQGSQLVLHSCPLQPGDKIVKISASFGDDVWDAQNYGQVGVVQNVVPIDKSTKLPVCSKLDV